MSSPPLVSVVVPTRNSAATLRACLESIRAQAYRHVELLLVDRESSDGTLEIAAEQGARMMQHGPERSAQRNAGARAARGEWVLFVDSDMVLDPDVVGDAVRTAASGAAVVVPEVGFTDTLLARLRDLEKRCYIGNEDVEAARFFPRRRFLALGGYDEGLTAAEDWDLTDRWRAAGGTVARTGAVIHHDDRSLTFRELLRKRYRYGRLYLRYVRKDTDGAAGHLGPGRFLSRLPMLARTPLRSLLLLSLKALEAAAFFLGLAAARVGDRHARPA